MNPKKTLFALLIAAAGLLSGCVTHIQTNVVENPPPAEKLSDFTRFVLKNVTLPPAYAGMKANQKSLAKIQQNVSFKMLPVLQKWRAAVPANAPARTLVIEPAVTQIKFINATARFWAGPIAGSSAVILKARLYDQETNRTIAEPIFYARAEAWGGAFSMGTTDNLMLTRVARRLTNYLIANYPAAVGGPTGAVPEEPAKPAHPPVAARH